MHINRDNIMHRDICWLLATFIIPKYNKFHEFIDTSECAYKHIQLYSEPTINLIRDDIIMRATLLTGYFLYANPEANSLIRDYCKNTNCIYRDPAAIDVIWDENIHCHICQNPAVIDIIRDDIKNNQGKNINWNRVCENPAIDILTDDFKNNSGEHIDWRSLCMNPAAIDILTDDIRNNGGRRIYWHSLYSNPAAIDLIRDDIKNNGGININMDWLQRNPAAIDITMDYIEKIGTKSIGII